MRRCLLPVLLLLAAPACVFPMMVRNPMTGSVVDARTGAPLVDAQICVEDWRVGHPTPFPVEFDGSALVSTDIRGRYSIPGRHKWSFIVPFGPEPLGARYWLPRLIVAHEGYASKTFNEWQGEGEPWREGFPPDPVDLEPLDGGSGKIACPLARDVSDLPPFVEVRPGPIWRGPANSAEECVGTFDREVRDCVPP